MRLWLILLMALLAGDIRTPLQAATNRDCTSLYAAFTEMRAEGPRIRVPALTEGTRTLASINRLTFLQYNVENLFNYQGKWRLNEAGQRTMIFPPKPKPEDRIARLRENILRANPDIMTWQEVENMPAAEEFVATQLGGRYRVLLINGNDPLGLGIALLVRRDLPFDILLQSHRELENEGNRIFTRDFVTAEFRSPGSPSSQAPLFRIMNTHNKSQRNSPGDERSLARRTRQVEAQARIIQSMERRHPGVPSFLMGDMNAELRSAPELQGLWAIGYRDGFNVASETLPPEQRITQSYFPNNSEAVHSQLDGIIASPAAQAPGIVERMEVVADQFPDGRPMPLPRNLSERERQGSDHRALRMEVNFRRIYEIWRARN